jgi:hypothetical protein
MNVLKIIMSAGLMSVLLFSVDSRKLEQAVVNVSLSRTHECIEIARIDLAKGKNHTGSYTRAVEHQAFAYQLWKEHDFDRAEAHTLYARDCARHVVKENKGRLGEKFSILESEKIISYDEKILHEELEKKYTGIRIKDEKKEVVHPIFKLEINIK